MFTPLGLFQGVPCPQGDQCSLLTCIFSHGDISRVDGDRATPQQATPEEAVLKTSQPGSALKTNLRTEKPLPSEDVARLQTTALKDKPYKKPQERSQALTKLQSISRNVSPPPTRGSVALEKQNFQVNTSVGFQLRRQAPKESLNPRMLPKAPAPHNVRSAIVMKLHATVGALNSSLEKSAQETEKHLVLSSNELVTMTLDEEERVARENPTIYSNIIKLRIVKLSKMDQEDWIKEVKAHLNFRYYKTEGNKQLREPKPFTTELSAMEEVAISRKLVTPLVGLEQHGYVTKLPTDEEVEQAKRGLLESKGWEKCDRCGGRFQVFPGRRADGSLTAGGQCTYHHGKPLYPPRKKTDLATGAREAYYSCCNEAVGTSSGCTKAETHVFKVSDPKRLASILQFQKTPDQPGKELQQPVCFDCEMGYTTQGLELIRLTAISWPEGYKLLDILVRPLGEILDLNSRFSGVFPEHYTTAVHFGTDVSNTAPEDKNIGSTPMQLVESPAAAREILFRHLLPSTPLIGHAIDNDLNACRIIHPTVIDTALLYPHQAGLPARMSLRLLAKKYLDRDIQTGGSSGHDSMEDSLATGDLVRVKALETWKRLKGRGWAIQSGSLIPPPGVKDTEDGAAAGTLGLRTGRKRKGREDE